MMPFAKALAAHPGLSLGAIRWDPWYEPNDDGERRAVERTLGTPTYRDRAPSCAVVIDPEHISFAACDAQARIDAEIGAAHEAGLDYWAYCWYGATNRMQEAWRLHQASGIRARMNWCLLFSSYHLFGSEAGSSTLSALVGYLSQDNYQRVRVGGTVRPIVYVLDAGGGDSGISQAMAAFRSGCSAAGLAAPYIVLLGSRPSMTAGAAAAVGGDAAGAYAFSQVADRAPYKVLAQLTEAHWPAMAATRQPIVPTAMTGWDRRPRIERPVPWETPTPANSQRSNYYEAGLPSQIAAHVAAMLAWIRANRTACPAQTGLIYSWDEHDEGGSCLNPSIGSGEAVLAAVGRIL